MNDRRDDTPTDRFARGRPADHADAHQRLPAPIAAAKRWNTGRNIVAAVLLLTAPLFPWNLNFGVGVPHSSSLLYASLAAATVLSLLAVGIDIAKGPRTNRLRLGLNAPLLLLVASFVAYDVVQTLRYGGTATVPGGVGPGAWLGLAGALLSAQPALSGTTADDGSFRSWVLPVRIVGYASIVLAALSVAFNLFWRIKAALPGSGGSTGFGVQNGAIIATAVVYGVVPLAAVVVASRWVLQGDGRSSRLASVALGASTLVAGVTVWLLPVGREIDGFHGVAQNTSTAGVGFEGYLAWVAAAAIFAPLTLLKVVTTHQIDRGVWRSAARKGLLLITLWCLASVVMRATDVAVTAVLHLSRSPYDSAAMAAFDLVTAVLAVWLRLNLVNRSLPVAVASALCAILLVFTIVRIVVGIALAPRVAGMSAEAGVVYGNNLAQQITSTFDVVLSGLALCILVVAVVTARFVQRRPRPDDRRQTASAPPARWDADTTRMRPGAAQPADPGRQGAVSSPPLIHRSTEQRRISVGAGRDDNARQLPPTAAPRIFRSTGSPTIHRPQGPGEPSPEQRPR